MSDCANPPCSSQAGAIQLQTLATHLVSHTPCGYVAFWPVMIVSSLLSKSWMSTRSVPLECKSRRTILFELQSRVAQSSETLVVLGRTWGGRHVGHNFACSSERCAIKRSHTDLGHAKGHSDRARRAKRNVAQHRQMSNMPSSGCVLCLWPLAAPVGRHIRAQRPQLQFAQS